MIDESELKRLLSLINYRKDTNHVEGLDSFRHLLNTEPQGPVLAFLTREMGKLEGRMRSGVICVITEHYLKTDDLENIRQIFTIEDSDAKESVLNALCGEPKSAETAAGIIALAVQGAEHDSPIVRAEACRVFKNQADWKVDVSAVLDPLLRLLGDTDTRVLSEAAYATGILAKNKYNLTQHRVPLTRNLDHTDRFVREASAWALWQLSRFKHDIAAAVPQLVRLLNDVTLWETQHKYAAGALLHHARKSSAGARCVKECAAKLSITSSPKPFKHFLEQLRQAT